MRRFFRCIDAWMHRCIAIINKKLCVYASMPLCIFLLIFAFCILHFASPVFSQQVDDTQTTVLQGGVEFDWISKTQLQRDENIKQIQDILFNEKTVLKYPKNEFKAMNAGFLKDKDSTQHYVDISHGKKEDANNYYAGFFLKNGLLIAYGVQSRNNMKNVYYYDTLGNLRFVDYYSDSYPKFPYYALQYGINGKLIGTIYFISEYDQYIFNPDKTFKGRWYKEKMYNRNAKVILTRSNY